MRTVEITFPQPNRPLSINEANRMHWAARRRRLEPWRVALLAELRRPEVRDVLCGVAVSIRVHVTLSFPRRGRRDPHNYVSTVVKGLVDTIVTAGVVPDDTAEWVTVVEPTLAIDPAETCRVTITREIR